MKTILIVVYLVGLMFSTSVVSKHSSGDSRFDFAVEFTAILAWPLLWSLGIIMLAFDSLSYLADKMDGGKE